MTSGVPIDLEGGPAVVLRAFDELAEAVAPRRIVIDEQTWAQWQHGHTPELRQLVEELPDRYRVEPVREAGFRGVVVVGQQWEGRAQGTYMLHGHPAGIPTIAALDPADA